MAWPTASCGQSCTNTGSACWHQTDPGFLKLPISSFFFRINADNWCTQSLESAALLGNVLELSVPLRRTARLTAPGIRLGRVAEFVEQPSHRRPARRVAGRAQQLAQLSQRAALALGPPAHRIAGGLRGEEALQRHAEPSILHLPRRASATLAADALRRAVGQAGR